jgi:hypothetical protein
VEGTVAFLRSSESNNVTEKDKMVFSGKWKEYTNGTLKNV